MHGTRPRMKSSLLFLLLAVREIAVTTGDSISAQCRDRFLEPFSSDSIWNTAIGSAASFAAANLYADAATNPLENVHNDQDFFLRVTNDDPIASWVSQGDWGGDDHCAVTGDVAAEIPLPADWTTASDCAGAAFPDECRSPPGQPNNNAMGVLLPDNETIVQMQPAYRCSSAAPLLARFGNDTDGCPQQFPNVTSIFSGGALGAHGGSGLSGVGGTIRLGELLPSSPPIGHALKLELNHMWYYGQSKLQNDSAYNGGRTQYVWPATGSDSCSNGVPGGCYGGTDPNVVPGALLALDPTSASFAALNVSTEVGNRVKQALTDYGGYIVDDTGGSGNTAAICLEATVNDEMREQYGYAMTVSKAK